MVGFGPICTNYDKQRGPVDSLNITPPYRYINILL